MKTGSGIRNRTLNPMLKTDFYKPIHHFVYEPTMEYLVSYWTPRMSRVKEIDKVVLFGLQYAIKHVFIDDFGNNFFGRPWEDIELEYKRYIGNTMSPDVLDISFMKQLYDLGYIPIQIKAVPEGMPVNIKTPMFQIKNTVAGFGWLVNYIETILSTNVWLPCTSATIAHALRSDVNKHWDKAVGDYGVYRVDMDKGKETVNKLDVFVDLSAERKFACGDFSMRGMFEDSSMASAAGHLLSFASTATIDAIPWLEDYYNCDCTKELVGRGVPSLEHSVVSSWGKDREYDCFLYYITQPRFKNGPLSMIADTYDIYHVVNDHLPRLRPYIEARNGRTLLRPDSGNPVDIICGTFTDEIEHIEGLTLKDIAKHYEKQAEKDWRNYAISNTYYTEIDGVVYKVDCYYGMDDEECWDNSVSVEYEEKILTDEEWGVLRLMWRLVGGYINEKGFRLLDPHYGIIYGDGITMERLREIYIRMEKMKFAPNNCVLGIGSYTYQYVTRDTFGFALKATHSICAGKEIQIFKDPITDKGKGNNFKKSQRGMCYVYRDGNDILYTDEHTIAELDSDPQYSDNLLKTVFCDGVIVKDWTLKEVRENLNTEYSY